MTLEEIEKQAHSLAQHAITADSKWAADVLLTVLPVVREVEHLCGPAGIDNPPSGLERALAAMRRALEEK